MLRKFRLLFDHYEIPYKGDPFEDDNAGWILAMALAVSHVPGFRVKTRTRTKPVTWGFFEKLLLRIEVATIVAERQGRSKIKACQILIEEGRYSGQPKDLQRRLIEAKADLPVEAAFRRVGRLNSRSALDTFRKEAATIRGAKFLS